MPEINSKEDWWFHYNKNLTDLICIVLDYVDRKYAQGLAPNDVEDQMEEWGRERKYSQTLYCYLNSSWFNAPENGCREIPGWFVLCDLCSENWVFEEDMMIENGEN